MKVMCGTGYNSDHVVGTKRYFRDVSSLQDESVDDQGKFIAKGRHLMTIGEMLETKWFDDGTIQEGGVL